MWEPLDDSGSASFITQKTKSAVVKDTDLPASAMSYVVPVS